MDVTLVRGSVYELPSNSRVGAIVYDGATDLRLWRGPGSDRDLGALHGSDLQRALDVERGKLGLEEIELGQAVRVHPGRLHCDFLAWVGTRAPESGTERHPAPGEDLLRKSVLSVLEFVAERDVKRVGFPAIGGGPDELPRVDRLEIIVRAAHEYAETCFREGRPPVVEQVLVCEPLGSVVAEVQRRVARLVKQAAPPVTTRFSSDVPARPARKSAPRRPRKSSASLDPDMIERARSTAPPYAMNNTYLPDDWFVHKKFGVGKVEQVAPDGWMMVTFEDGTQKRMVHGRS